MMSEFLTTPSIRTCSPGHPLQPVNIHLKPKSSNASILVQVFDVCFVSADALCNETGGGNIVILVSKLDCMDLSSVIGLPCIISEKLRTSLFLCYYDAGQKRYYGKDH